MYRKSHADRLSPHGFLLHGFRPSLVYRSGNRETPGSIGPVSQGSPQKSGACRVHTCRRQPVCSEGPLRQVVGTAKFLHPLSPHSRLSRHVHIPFCWIIGAHDLLESSLARISVIFCSSASMRLSLSALSFLSSSISFDCASMTLAICVFVSAW